MAPTEHSNTSLGNQKWGPEHQRQLTDDLGWTIPKGRNISTGKLTARVGRLFFLIWVVSIKSLAIIRFWNSLMLTRLYDMLSLHSVSSSLLLWFTYVAREGRGFVMLPITPAGSGITHRHFKPPFLTEWKWQEQDTASPVHWLGI